MSVRFLVVRFITAHQVDLWSDNTDPWADLRGDEPPSSLRSYQLVEMVTTGWAGGARCRTKRVSLNQALVYVNKLHAGHWIDDSEYNRAYGAVSRLLQKCRVWAPSKGEAFPYSFGLVMSEEASSGE